MPGERPRYVLTAGSSLYMSGEQNWHVYILGKPGIRATFRARLDEAEKIIALINGRDES